MDSFDSLLREEEIYLGEIIHSNTEEIKSCEGLKILLISDKFIDDMSNEMSDLIFCSDNSNAVICINSGPTPKIAKTYDEEKVFFYLKEPVEEAELLKAIKKQTNRLL